MSANGKLFEWLINREWENVKKHERGGLSTQEKIFSFLAILVSKAESYNGPLASYNKKMFLRSVK